MKTFKINQYHLKIARPKNTLHTALRMVMLSDLHGNTYGDHNKILLHKINELRPDLVVMAGDMITAGKSDIPDAVFDLLHGLAARYPVFYGNGNHERHMKEERSAYPPKHFAKYREFLQQEGIYILENANVSITMKGLSMTFYGLDIEMSYYQRFCRQKLEPAKLEKLLGIPKENTYSILIAHNPMSFPAYAAWGADLIFSGHLHGGFLRLPLLGGVISPQMQLFPKYDKGRFDSGRCSMIVGSGIGDHFLPPRLFNPRELVVVDCN